MEDYGLTIPVQAQGVPLIKDCSYSIPSFLCDYIIYTESGSLNFAIGDVLQVFADFA